MRVCAVVVAFHPASGSVDRLCQELLANGTDVVVVDNSEPPTPLSTPRGVRLISLGENTGIAHALNVGIAAGLENGAEAIAFFDQDSSVSPGFIRKLTDCLEPARPTVVAPVAFNRRTGEEYPSERLTKLGAPKPVLAGDSVSPYAVDLVISSGIVATASVFRMVGLMDESLFIDFVDYDWCLRCRASDIPILVVPSARLGHAIGEQEIKAWRYRGTIHGPSRTYYKIRNSLLLFRRPHFPLQFALRQILSTVWHNTIQLFFVRDPRAYARNYLSAIRDGLAGRTGKRR